MAISRSPAPTGAISLTDVAKAAFQAGRLPPGLEGGLYETGTFAPDDNTYPNGCHVCEVEIDPDTGALEIVRYVVDRRCRHGGEPDRPARARSMAASRRGWARR